MKKEEILAKSREENQQMDEMELYVQAKAGKLAMDIGGVLCMILLLLDSLRTGKINQCLYAVYLGMLSVFYFATYKGIRKKEKLYFGILFGMIAICFLGLYIAEWVMID